MALQLKDGRVIEGKLVGFDQYMNLVLEESEERHTPRGSPAAPATPVGEEGAAAVAGTMTSRRLGTVILRGNNVVTIAPQ